MQVTLFILLLTLGACSSSKSKTAKVERTYDGKQLEAFLEQEGKRVQFSEQEVPWETEDDSLADDEDRAEVQEVLEGDEDDMDAPAPRPEDRQKALDRYRKLRLQKKTPPSRREVRKPKSRVAVSAPAPKAAPVLSPEAQKDIQIEMEQNLAYYCLQAKNSKRFENSTDCESFAQSVKSECVGAPPEEGAEPQLTKRSLSCVLTRLKKK
jgi:hypothetical protein